MRPAALIHVLSYFCLAGLAVWSTPGCGTSLVEPGRSSYSRPIVSPSAGSVPAGAPAVSDSNALPHVPLSQLLPTTPVNANAVYHEVQAGDTLSSIATRYRVGADQLRRTNGLDARASLQPGQLIYIPGAG